MVFQPLASVGIIYQEILKKVSVGNIPLTVAKYCKTGRYGPYEYHLGKLNSTRSAV